MKQKGRTFNVTYVAGNVDTDRLWAVIKKTGDSYKPKLDAPVRASVDLGGAVVTAAPGAMQFDKDATGEVRVTLTPAKGMQVTDASTFSVVRSGDLPAGNVGAWEKTSAGLLTATVPLTVDEDAKSGPRDVVLEVEAAVTEGDKTKTVKTEIVVTVHVK